MIRAILFLIILQCLYLGYVFGKIYQLKEQIIKQTTCIDYIYADNININKFFNEDLKDVSSIFLHSYAAVSLKYNQCMWGMN